MSQPIDLQARLSQFLIEELAPILHIDRGAVELLDVSDGVVRIRLGGTRSCYPSSLMTIIHGLEQEMRRRFPEVEYLEALP
jgi:Fe-S cluster biogenesis protein NfuA